jgi:hypothetical protein
LPEAVFTAHLLSAGSPLKFPRAQFRRHLDKSQFAGWQILSPVNNPRLTIQS